MPAAEKVNRLTTAPVEAGVSRGDYFYLYAVIDDVYQTAEAPMPMQDWTVKSITLYRNGPSKLERESADYAQAYRAWCLEEAVKIKTFNRADRGRLKPHGMNETERGCCTCVYAFATAPFAHM